MDLTATFERVKAAGRSLLRMSGERVNEILLAVADEMLAQAALHIGGE